MGSAVHDTISDVTVKIMPRGIFVSCVSVCERPIIFGVFDHADPLRLIEHLKTNVDGETGVVCGAHVRNRRVLIKTVFDWKYSVFVFSLEKNSIVFRIK